MKDISKTLGMSTGNLRQNMNVSAAADYIGIGERTLRELIARGDIRSVRIGRRVVLRRKDLEDFLEANLV